MCNQPLGWRFKPVYLRELCALAACAILANPGAVHAQIPCRYEVDLILSPTCPDGINNGAVGTAISDTGIVAGHYPQCGFGGGHESFIWRGPGQFQKLQRPAGVLSARALGVSDDGIVVGSMTVPGFADRAFRHDGTGFVALGVLPNDHFSWASDITPDGSLIVGTSANIVKGPYTAVRWFRQGPSAIPGLDNFSSDAVDVNSKGCIVGRWGISMYEGFLWCDGIATDLGALPGSIRTLPGALNNSQQVVGASIFKSDVYQSPFASRAFIWENGLIRDLGLPPGFDTCSAKEINDAATVLGACGELKFPNHIEYFIWHGQAIVNIQELVSQDFIVYPVAMNNHGEITGGAFHVPTLQSGACRLRPIYAPAGDTNCDAHVDMDDILQVINLWGECEPGALCRADLDHDGRVGIPDLMDVIVNWD